MQFTQRDILPMPAKEPFSFLVELLFSQARSFWGRRYSPALTKSDVFMGETRNFNQHMVRFRARRHFLCLVNSTKIVALQKFWHFVTHYDVNQGWRTFVLFFKISGWEDKGSKWYDLGRQVYYGNKKWNCNRWTVAGNVPSANDIYQMLLGPKNASKSCDEQCDSY